VDNNGKWTGHINATDSMDYDKIEKLRKSRKPLRIFIGSMCDLFHPALRLSALNQIWDAVKICAQHTFIVLTKRAERMLKCFIDYEAPPNLLVGVSAEDQERAEERIPVLLKTPAAGHFVSLEPLLGPVDLTFLETDSGKVFDSLTGKTGYMVPHTSETPRLKWVICGAEQGPRKRWMDMEWAVSVRTQCAEAGVPFFFKKNSRGNPFCRLEITRQFPAAP
jgi:protein gp37